MSKRPLNIDQFLESYRGRELFFRPNPGNAGDALISLSAIKLFEKNGIKYRIADEHSDLQGQTVFYSGGGNLVKYYTHCADFISKWKSRVKELVILPHTINGHRPLLSSLGENVTIFCRELKTFDYIRSFENIKSVYLSHDLAFKLHFNEDLVRANSPNTLVKISPSKTVLKALLKKEKLPGFFIRRIDASSSLNAFREDVEASGLEVPEGNIDLSHWCNQKVDMVTKRIMEESSARLASTINKFELIRTDRLHIAIAAAKLNKRVDFFNNSYDKNKTVYDYSMKGVYPKVIWKGDLNPNSK